MSPRPRALAQSLGIGVIGVTSLDILVAGAAEAGHRGLVLACVDARRGEVFATVRDDRRRRARSAAAPRRPRPVHAGGPGGACWAGLGGAAVRAVGDGALRYADVLGGRARRRTRGRTLSFPPPAALLGLALARLEAGETPVEPRCVVPLYMREADARSNFARAARA